MPNDKDTLEEIKMALEAATPEPREFEGVAVIAENHMNVAYIYYQNYGPLFANASKWLRYLLQQIEQQQAEIEDWKLELDSANRVNHSLITQLQQSREENERLTREIKSHGPEGRNYTNAQYVELRLENERLRGELERYEERRQTAALEVGKLVIEHDQLKAERDDYRKVLEWYADIDAYTVIHLGCSPMVMSDRGKLACDILYRYEKGEYPE